MAGEMYNNVIKTMSAQDCEDMREHFAKSWHAAFEFNVPVLEDVEKFTKKYVRGDQCVVCSKTCTSSHTESGLHKKRVMLCERLDALCGEPEDVRVLFAGLAAETICKETLNAYWGKELANFGAQALQLLRRVGLRCKVRAAAPELQVAGVAIEACSVIVVPYTSTQQCKYDGVWAIPYPMIADTAIHDQQDAAAAVRQNSTFGWWPCVEVTVSRGVCPEGDEIASVADQLGKSWLACVYQLAEAFDGAPCGAWLCSVNRAARGTGSAQWAQLDKQLEPKGVWRDCTPAPSRG